MKNTFTYRVLALLFTAFCVSNVTGQGIEFEHDKSFDEVLQMAKKQDKLIFMDCYTTWCGPCKRLAAVVFPDPEVGTYFNQHFINTKFDMERGDGITIANKYAIRAYPTLLWLNGDGEVVHKIVGGLDPTGLIQNGQKANDPTPGILSGMRRQYSTGNRDLHFLADYLNTLYNAKEKYEDVLTEYMAKLTPKDYNDPKHSRTVFNLTNSLESPGLDYVLKNRDLYSGLMGENAYNDKMYRIAQNAEEQAAKATDAALFNRAMDFLKNSKAGNANERMLELSMDYYARTNDWDNYDKNASQYIKKYAAKNAALLSDVAWNYYINVNDKAQLTKAAKWAADAINLDNKYTYNLTYAYLVYKLNDLKEAEKACDYAIIRANEENVQPTSATALKDVIKKALNP